MNAGRKRLAIFDLDGTIVQFAIDSKAARADVIAYFDEIGIPKKALDIKNSIIDLFTRARLLVQEEGLPEPDWDEVRRRVLDIIESYERVAAKVSKPVPGIHGVLETLTGHGVLMAVCTLNTTPNANGVLRKHGLAGYFEVVAGRDVVGDRMKPDPWHGMYVVERVGVTLENCVMVGDHPADVQMATSMGIKAIAITSTRHGPEAFSRFGEIELLPDNAYDRLPGMVLRACSS